MGEGSRVNMTGGLELDTRIRVGLLLVMGRSSL